MQIAPKLAARAPDVRSAATLILNDNHYFEAVATQRSLDDATLSFLPGLTNLAGGCVLHRIRRDQWGFDPAESVLRWERAVWAVGGSRFRLYLVESDAALENVLRQRGDLRHCRLGGTRAAAANKKSVRAPRVAGKRSSHSCHALCRRNGT